MKKPSRKTISQSNLGRGGLLLLAILLLFTGFLAGCKRKPKPTTLIPGMGYVGSAEPEMKVSKFNPWQPQHVEIPELGGADGLRTRLAEKTEGWRRAREEYLSKSSRTSVRPQKPTYDGKTLESLLQRVPSALPSRDEEIWVVCKESSHLRHVSDDAPASGALLGRLNEKEVPLPLKHTDVKATISAYIASVNVTQQFHNPYDQKIEAVYVFPLPHNAAVNEFIMTIGERRIRGIIRERSEAEQIYQAAKQQGYTASLLTQERPNIFTQSVANIEPGKQVDIFIRYFHTLAYTDGWYEFVFPMVVGPRFNPPGTKDGIGAVARGKSGSSGQPNEVTYLKPGERSGHDIAVKVDINAGSKIEDISCQSHVLQQSRHSDDRFSVSISPNDAIPNKDLVIRYKVAGEKLKANWLSHKAGKENFFSLMLYPPQQLQSLKRHPLELVFVLDCSGSMNGRPLEQAKAAIARALQQMQPDDTFQLINFSVSARKLGSRPLPATPDNVRKGLDYLASLNSEGGTMMVEGIKAALDFPHDQERLRFVCFLTDGYIGNEREILEEINRRLEHSRIFSFGIGSSVNRYLMDAMAKTGRGTVAYLGNNESAADLMDIFFQQISHPAMTDIKIDWNGLQMNDVFPKRLPDLFSGRPVIVTGKYAGAGTGEIVLRGKVDGKNVAIRVPVKGDSDVQPGLPAVWARHKIAALADEAVYAPSSEVVDDIRQLALDHSLMSAFTAFVAVDASQKTPGRSAGTVPVSVPLPDGVSYRKTVNEK